MPEPASQGAERRSVGTVLHCPACGHEHRRKYVPAAALNEARAELGRFLELMHWVMPNLNDTFAYATADSERIYMDGVADDSYDEDDMPTNTDTLIRVFRNYGLGGIVAYVAKMRGVEPIKPCRTVDYENAVLALKDWTYEPD